MPDELVFKTKEFQSKLLDSSRLKGYTPIQILGKGDAILRLPTGRLEGGADYRGDDAVLSF
ncbi:hypothetical protein [Psychroflexus torquis]|uniref:hypothetical protein n=1 Tax=Psychroflexus torquis TaxID=57029 RepID=UPI0000D53D83|nr:hypothetical protein [Psychroflexus torquis]